MREREHIAMVRENSDGTKKKIVGDAGLILAVAVLIVSGVRSLRRQGFSWKRIIRPVLGVGISLAYISVSYYDYYVFSYGEETFYAKT